MVSTLADQTEISKLSPPGPPVPEEGAAIVHGDPKAGAFGEVGVTGLKVYSGYVNEEYLTELKGTLANKIYRIMADDSVVNSVLMAISLMLRAVDWRVEPADDSKEAEDEAEFARSLLDDMSHTWEDTVGEILSMLQFGWSYHEIVLKRRVGPDQKDPSKRSKYDDGRIGIRKLPIRSQDSLLKWDMQEDGGVAGMWQQSPTGGPTLFIPIERGLLFRTVSTKNSPEGRSILRSAYRAWFLKRGVEDMESIGIERELAGLPIVSIPKKYFNKDGTAEEKAFLAEARKIARDVKFNQQGGVVIPSETFTNNDGSLSSVKMMTIELLTTAGRRAIETDPVVQRYNRDIARSALADFLTLGDQKGSYALSQNKSELFLRACESFLNEIAAVWNRFLLPRIWDYNGLPRETMPLMKPGRLAPVDLTELGAYLQALSAAGAPLFPNQELSEYLADVAGLPEPPEDIGLMAQPGQTPKAGQIDPNTGKPIQPEIDPKSGRPMHEVEAEQTANDLAAMRFETQGSPGVGKAGGNPYHDQHGRFTYAPGVKASGVDETKRVRKEWEQQSPFHTAQDLTANSAKNQASFAAIGHSVAAKTGTEFVNPGPKSVPRLIEKRIELELLEKIERGKRPETITDAVRGGFKVEQPHHADAVVAELAKHYQLADEGWAMTDSGYFDRKVIARMPDKQLAEVQFWHPEMLAAKEGKGQGHKLYEAQQALEKINPRHPLIPQVKQAQRELYGGARSRMPGVWQAVHMAEL